MHRNLKKEWEKWTKGIKYVFKFDKQYDACNGIAIEIVIYFSVENAFNIILYYVSKNIRWLTSCKYKDKDII
jgi:hypothetical protein